MKFCKIDPCKEVPLTAAGVSSAEIGVDVGVVIVVVVVVVSVAVVVVVEVVDVRGVVVSSGDFLNTPSPNLVVNGSSTALTSSPSSGSSTSPWSPSSFSSRSSSSSSTKSCFSLHLSAAPGNLALKF
jgi:hypothetical protein